MEVVQDLSLIHIWHEGKHYGVQDKRGVVKEFLPFAKFISFQPIKLYLKNIVPEISMSDIGIIPYIDSINTVSYTHLDVYKRQEEMQEDIRKQLISAKNII